MLRSETFNVLAVRRLDKNTYSETFSVGGVEDNTNKPKYHLNQYKHRIHNFKFVVAHIFIFYLSAKNTKIIYDVRELDEIKLIKRQIDT